MNIAIIGLGLIGGSMALELRASKQVDRVLGMDQNEGHARQALALGLIDEIITDVENQNLDAVIVAVPVHLISAIVTDILHRLANKTAVIDTGSTKGKICEALATHPHRAYFVAAHPIAGTEYSGPEAASIGLFQDKNLIICEKEKSNERSLAIAHKLFSWIGAKVIYMDAAAHDRHIAYVSHLSHLSSFLLGQTVLDIEKDEKNIFDLAGSGFSSTVRLAKSSPETWTPIFEQNAEYLSQALLEYIMYLQRFQYYLLRKDKEGIKNALLKANDIKRVLNDPAATDKTKK